MIAEQSSQDDPRVEAALDELQALIQHRYPDATFTISEGEDPDGIYLRATVDVEDIDDVVAVFIDRLVPLQVEDALPVYVLALRPVERIGAMLQASATKRPARALLR